MNKFKLFWIIIVLIIGDIVFIREWMDMLHDEAVSDLAVWVVGAALLGANMFGVSFLFDTLISKKRPSRLN